MFRRLRGFIDTNTYVGMDFVARTPYPSNATKSATEVLLKTGEVFRVLHYDTLREEYSLLNLSLGYVESWFTIPKRDLNSLLGLS